MQEEISPIAFIYTVSLLIVGLIIRLPETPTVHMCTVSKFQEVKYKLSLGHEGHKVCQVLETFLDEFIIYPIFRRGGLGLRPQ